MNIINQCKWPHSITQRFPNWVVTQKWVAKLGQVGCESVFGKHEFFCQLFSIYPSMGSALVGVQCPFTSSLGEFLGHWGLVSWAFARVGVHRLSLCLPYLAVFPFTLHLPLSFIRVSSLRPTYLHPFSRPFTYSLFR